MNKKIFITNRLNRHSGEGVVFFIEDYIRYSRVTDARKLTDKIFFNNADFVSECDYKGYKITWSWYSDVFQFCIKYLEIKALIDKIERLNVYEIKVGEIDPQYKKVLSVYFFNKNVVSSASKKGAVFKKIKQFLLNIVMLFFSLISMLFFIFKPGKNIGTYTGDFIYRNTKSDFRLERLYKKYKRNNIQYIEFIRSTTTKNFFINIFKRKRFSIYYTSIIYFVDLFSNKIQYRKTPQDFHQSILYGYYHANVVLKKSALIIEKIFKILRIDKFVLISFSSRSAHLAIAAKASSIKTIGIMHGLQQKDYAVYEFMQGYQEDKKIGCDVYGVWSPYYLEYFKEYSKISDTGGFQYSGLLRPVKNINQATCFQKVSKDTIKVLLISEPLIMVSEIIPYLKYLLKSSNIEIGIKVRPMVEDTYYDNIKLKLPEIQNLKTYDGRLEDVADRFDVFVGSNSTAVIEASLFGKVSILLNTIKFGDYFDMDTLISGHKLLVKRPELLCSEIQFRVENEVNLKTIEKTKNRFFGNNKDGAQWVVDQL